MNVGNYVSQSNVQPKRWMYVFVYVHIHDHVVLFNGQKVQSHQVSLTAAQRRKEFQIQSECGNRYI